MVQRAERLQLVNDQLESCRTKQQHLLATLYRIEPNNVVSHAEVTLLCRLTL